MSNLLLVLEGGHVGALSFTEREADMLNALKSTPPKQRDLARLRPVQGTGRPAESLTVVFQLSLRDIDDLHCICLVLTHGACPDKTCLDNLVLRSLVTKPKELFCTACCYSKRVALF